MYENEFADKLRKLMKEKRISGQKIAREIGLSQKTISRYATGETKPSKETEKKILQVIANISGNSENTMKSTQRIIRENIRKYSKFIETEEEILNRDICIIETELNCACWKFSIMKKENQQFILDNFAVFANLNVYEIALIELFSQITEEDRKYIIDNLENSRLSLKPLQMYSSNCEKISSYMLMISKVEKVKLEQMEKFNRVCEEYEETELTKEFRKKLNSKSGLCIETLNTYLPELILFDARDWYLLTLVQIMSLKDRGANLTYNGSIVGDKIFFLIQYMEKLVGKYS